MMISDKESEIYRAVLMQTYSDFEQKSKQFVGIDKVNEITK